MSSQPSFHPGQLSHATQQGASRAVSVPPTQRCSQIRLWVPQPISYPGSPRSWGSLWAIGSSTSLKFTQREMQAFQVTLRVPTTLAPQ